MTTFILQVAAILSFCIGSASGLAWLVVANQPTTTDWTPNYIEVKVEKVDPGPNSSWTMPLKIEQSELVNYVVNISNITDISHYRGYNRKTPRVLITLVNAKELVVISDFDDIMKEIKKASSGIVAGN